MITLTAQQKYNSGKMGGPSICGFVKAVEASKTVRLTTLDYVDHSPSVTTVRDVWELYSQETTESPMSFTESPFSVTESSFSVISDRKPVQRGILWFSVVIPLICVFGVIGNVFTAIIFTRRRMFKSLDRLGRSAYHGLVALAMSDLVFCLTVLPHAFMPLVSSMSTEGSRVAMLYRIHGVSLINLLLMTSTWLVVMIAVTRYRAVAHPLEVRFGSFASQASVMITTVCVMSFILTLPYFIHTDVRSCIIPGTGLSWEFTPVFNKRLTRLLQNYIRWVWPVLADFIPICILVFCNIMLVRQLRSATLKRRHSCPGQKVRETSKRITVTLVSIILMQVILVTPSELLKYFNPYASWGRVGHVIAHVTNVMQTANFACNFLLYLAVNLSFRRTAKLVLFGKWPCGVKRSTDPTSQSYISLRHMVSTDVE